MGHTTGRSLGIDLSNDDSRVGICTIDWEGPEVRFHPDLRAIPEVGSCGDISDEGLACVIRGALEGGYAIAIDVPFAWPKRWLDAIENDGEPLNACDRSEARFRGTEHHLIEIKSHLASDESDGRRDIFRSWRGPLSGAADKLAITVARMRNLLHIIDDDRGGSDLTGRTRHLYETYPGACLANWGVEPTGYKSGKLDERSKRSWEKASQMLEAVHSEVDLSLHDLDRACRSFVSHRGLSQLEDGPRLDHDQFDAFVCAVAARLIAAQSERHSELCCQKHPHMDRIDVEGWIHVPGLTSWGGDHPRLD